MAEFVQLRLEEKVNVIINRRRGHEYKLRRKLKSKSDYLDYISYEKNLLALVEIRRNKFTVKKSGLESSNKKSNISSQNPCRKAHLKETLIERGIVNRIHRIYREALKRYPQALDIWKERLDFAKERVAVLEDIENGLKLKKETKLKGINKNRILGKIEKVGKRMAIAEGKVTSIYGDLIGVQSKEVWIWAEAASWQFDRDMSCIDKVRMLLRKALRNFEIETDEEDKIVHNPTSSKINNGNTNTALIWLTYFRIEMLYCHKMRKRSQILFFDNKSSKCTQSNNSTSIKLVVNAASETQQIDQDKMDIDIETRLDPITNGEMICLIYRHALTSELKSRPQFVLDLVNIIKEYSFAEKLILPGFLEFINANQNIYYFVIAKIILTVKYGENFTTNNGEIEGDGGSDKLLSALRIIRCALKNHDREQIEKFVLFCLEFLFEHKQIFVDQTIIDSSVMDHCNTIFLEIGDILLNQLNLPNSQFCWERFLGFLQIVYETSNELHLTEHLTFFKGKRNFLRQAIKKSIELYPNCPLFWQIYIKYNINKINNDDLLRIFDNALLNLKENQTLNIWLLVLRWANETSFENNLMILDNQEGKDQFHYLIAKALTTLSCSEVLVPIKLFYLEYLWGKKGIDSASKIYEDCLRNRPYTYELFRKTIELFKISLNLSTKKFQHDKLLEQIFCDALRNFGQEEPTLWMDYIIFKREQKNYMFDKDYFLYDKAIKNLNLDKIEDFIKMYTITNTYK
ncbi:unnamed protein product [Gordionus sp. m RMFG-2023]|uniref:U3 small nucleolar RNA-associated protein 6 homolog isoform X2 n=1 Tax=Gordionus sp. m RMFG-2023 TaxID=3053472 RepID=UPI0030E1AF8D